MGVVLRKAPRSKHPKARLLLSTTCYDGGRVGAEGKVFHQTKEVNLFLRSFVKRVRPVFLSNWRMEEEVLP